MNITESAIKKLRPPKVGSVIYYDTDHQEKIPGFGVRLTAQGAVSFVLNYCVNGRERRCTIGRWPECSASRAREDAENLRYEIRKNGRDPLAEKEAARDEPLVSDLAHDYLTLYAEKKKRPTSLRNDRQMLERLILPRLKNLHVRAVGQRDIERLHGSLKDTPYQANRVLALLSKMFRLAAEWNWREDNPVRGVARYHEDKRETWLTIAELSRIERALGEYQDPEAADALRLLIVTGSREGEVLSADWSQFDLERGVWTKPSHHTKQKRVEHVPLNRAAIAILAKMQEDRRSNYLFPGKQGPRVTLRRPWVQVLRAAGLVDEYEVLGKRRRPLKRFRPKVRIHDLRHTFASHLVSRGESLHKVGKLLGHTSPQTTARYAHLDDKALRATANSFGDVYRRLH